MSFIAITAEPADDPDCGPLELLPCAMAGLAAVFRPSAVKRCHASRDYYFSGIPEEW
jgi:hypothetical protein